MTLIRREKPPKITDRLESVKSAAERLNCSRNTVLNLVGKGKIRCTNGLPLMVNSADVTAIIHEKFRQAGVEIDPPFSRRLSIVNKKKA